MKLIISRRITISFLWHLYSLNSFLFITLITEVLVVCLVPHSLGNAKVKFRTLGSEQESGVDPEVVLDTLVGEKENRS
jgi:hypothetical protein